MISDIIVALTWIICINSIGLYTYLSVRVIGITKDLIKKQKEMDAVLTTILKQLPRLDSEISRLDKLLSPVDRMRMPRGSQALPPGI